ncbi:hypothetical protein [Idiomarina loihiensis]|uniref:hypothetical protein n=1 Tax=Idiomarina loihiensis TaxID=135577 RepID=UPI0038508321
MAVTKIWAKGTRGEAKNRKFTAKTNRDGFYVLNRKVSGSTNNKTNHAQNKVYVSSLDETWNLLKTDEYVINLVCDEGTRALRSKGNVLVEKVSC